MTDQTQTTDADAIELIVDRYAAKSANIGRAFEALQQEIKTAVDDAAQPETMQ